MFLQQRKAVGFTFELLLLCCDILRIPRVALLSHDPVVLESNRVGACPAAQGWVGAGYQFATMSTALQCDTVQFSNVYTVLYASTAVNGVL